MAINAIQATTLPNYNTGTKRRKSLNSLRRFAQMSHTNRMVAIKRKKVSLRRSAK